MTSYGRILTVPDHLNPGYRLKSSMRTSGQKLPFPGELGTVKMPATSDIRITCQLLLGTATFGHLA